MNESHEEHIRNLEILKSIRCNPTPGDVFHYKIRNGNYYFGRVISNTACQMSITDLLLIYLYNVCSTQPYEIPNLSCSELLIPPILTNRQPWHKGYFVHLRNEPLSDEDVLPVHCFESMTFHKYYNEHNQILSKRHDPCGIYGVASYSVIDLEISHALKLIT